MPTPKAHSFLTVAMRASSQKSQDALPGDCQRGGEQHRGTESPARSLPSQVRDTGNPGSTTSIMGILSQPPALLSTPRLARGPMASVT